MSESVMPSPRAESAASTNSGAGFITPLPTMLANATQQIIRNAVGLHDGHRLRLPADSLQINVEGMGFVLRIDAGRDQLISVTAIPGTTTGADITTINASPVTLVLQVRTGKPGGKLTIQGDANVAQHWQQYFSSLVPDWEKGFSDRLGPVLGVQAFNLLSGLREWFQTSTEQTSETVSEYLREESQILVTRVEMDQFLDAVDDLSIRLDRLLAQCR